MNRKKTLSDIKERLKLLVLCAVVVLVLVGCGDNTAEVKKQQAMTDSLLNVAYQSNDYSRLETLADSLKKAGAINDVNASYWLGYANDKLMRRRIAEFYWNTGMAAFNPDVNKDDAELYAEMASRLAGLKCTLGAYETALKVAHTAVSQLQELGCDTTGNYTNLIIYIGYCQSRFGLNEETAAQTLEQAYQQHLGYIRQQPSSDNYRLAIIGLTNICYNYSDMCDFKNLLFWTNRYDSLVGCYDKTGLAASSYTDKQHGRSCVFRAKALEGMGRKSEADSAFAAFRQTHYGQTPDGAILAADYQMFSKKWKDAAESWSFLDEFRKQFADDYSMENIQLSFLKKYQSNLMAGRNDSAMVIAKDILAHLDSTITVSRRTEAIEQETVRLKEAEMAQEHEQALRHQALLRMVIMALLIIVLVIYIILRQHNANNRRKAHEALKKAHNELEVAYDKLEETTAAKERMESELRIARDIQMSMVPNLFPSVEGLDMFASMTPAKEVGGDLYGYVLIGDRLYFCIGDVSGKGVPASLFMAEATRLFRTLASQNMLPAEITTRMNAELAEGNEQGMFVTMFICMFDLKTDRLDYCNAGHNPPVINAQFIDVLPNAPIGLWPGLEYEGEVIEQMHGQRLLLYTDGLNEAENPQQDQYGEDRIIKLMTSFSPANSSLDIVEALKDDVEHFRDGAEPNDDLTMLAFRYSRK
jgi:serine phosphatase RsbU (regulator of sigma subunit)